MYEHIKKGDLVKIPGLSSFNEYGLPLHLVLHKESENGFYGSYVFILLNDKGEVIWFYANANNPYDDINLAFEI